MLKTEIEIKLPVKNMTETLLKVRQVATYSHAEYIRDVIYGGVKDKGKIRLRYQDYLHKLNIEAMYKNKTISTDGTKKEIEQLIYAGNSPIEALSAIQDEGKFKEENSYEKIRLIFIHPKVLMTIDIYPFGTWLEIESESVRDIWAVATKLGYERKDAITISADDLYLKWNKKAKHKELWDVRFGLNFRNL